MNIDKFFDFLVRLIIYSVLLSLLCITVYEIGEFSFLDKEKEPIKPIITTTVKMIEVKPLEELVINHILSANPNSKFETILKKGKDYYVVISKKENLNE